MKNTSKPKPIFGLTIIIFTSASMVGYFKDGYGISEAETFITGTGILVLIWCIPRLLMRVWNAFVFAFRKLCPLANKRGSHL